MFYKFCQSELHLRLWFPAKTKTVISFIAYCFQKGYATSSITSVLSALSFVHKMHGREDPTATFMVRKLLQGAAKLRPSGDQRAPVTKAILHQLVRSTPHISHCYYNSILTSAMYLLAFHAFLRIGEIAVTSTAKSSNVLQVSQLAITSSGCTVVFYAYKHYQGPPVTLAIPAHTDPLCCPVKAMRMYLALRGNSPGPLFVFPGGTPVSKSFFGGQLKKSLSWAGLPTTCYKGQFSNRCGHNSSNARGFGRRNTTHGALEIAGI